MTWEQCFFSMLFFSPSFSPRCYTDQAQFLYTTVTRRIESYAQTVRNDYCRSISHLGTADHRTATTYRTATNTNIVHR